MCYNIASVLCFGFWPRGMWDLSSLTRGGSHTCHFGRGSLHHCTAMEVPTSTLLKEGGREVTGCPFLNAKVRCACALSRVLPFSTLWTVSRQAPLSMGFSRQEYWIGLPFPSPGDLPDPGIKPVSPLLQADSLPLAIAVKPKVKCSNP